VSPVPITEKLRKGAALVNGRRRHAPARGVELCWSEPTAHGGEPAGNQTGDERVPWPPKQDQNTVLDAARTSVLRPTH
jgi:hypothetical protein